MRHRAGDTIRVESAGTDPGPKINALSAQTLLEVGADITDQHTQAVTDQLIADADLVVTLGRDAQVHPTDGTPVVNWDTDEPSARGIDGIERMRLVRDDITRRVDDLYDRLNAGD